MREVDSGPGAEVVVDPDVAQRVGEANERLQEVMHQNHAPEKTVGPEKEVDREKEVERERRRRKRKQRRPEYPTNRRSVRWKLTPTPWGKSMMRNTMSW